MSRSNGIIFTLNGFSRLDLKKLRHSHIHNKKLELIFYSLHNSDMVTNYTEVVYLVALKI